MFGELCLCGSVVAPLIGAGLSLTPRWRDSRALVALGWLSVTLALGALFSVGLTGPFVVALRSSNGVPVVGLWANQLTVTLAALVCAVGAIVLSFSLRYLQGDRRVSRFFAGANIVVAATVTVCAAATLTTLALSWVLAGAAFVVVLSSRRDLPGVRVMTCRTAKMFVVGDLSLVIASLLVGVRVGNLDLAAPGALHHAVVHLGILVTPVALLLAVAVLTRSAQGIFGRWLPGTVSAPTPSSALLHAGVVNGGGVLLLRLGVLITGSTLAVVAVFVVVSVTVVGATLAMTHKSDLKGSLAFSTMSQMGFMLAECVVGASLAAVVHLLGHALYKATSFLGSGSQIPRRDETPGSNVAQTSFIARSVGALAGAAASACAMIVIPGGLSHRGSLILLLFGTATAGAVSWSWWIRPPASTRIATFWIGVLVISGGIYGAVIAGLGAWIAPSLVAVGGGVLSPWWLAILGGVTLAATALTRLPMARRRVVALLVNVTYPREMAPSQGLGPATLARDGSAANPAWAHEFEDSAA